MHSNAEFAWCDMYVMLREKFLKAAKNKILGGQLIHIFLQGSS